LREIVDGDLECAEMAAGLSDFSLRYREIRPSRRHDRRRRFNQHGDVQMILEQVAGLDGHFVAPADENNTAALQVDDGHRWRGFGGCREQCRHFWPGLSGFTRPPGGLADIDELNRIGAATFRGYIGKQRGLLGASDRQRRVSRRNRAEPIEFGAA
jgi:hypothetical protein